MIKKFLRLIIFLLVLFFCWARPALAVNNGAGSDIFTGNLGIGTTTTAATLQVGINPSIIPGSSPAALIKGNMVVDGKIYGDGSGLTGISGAITGLNAGYIPQANSSTTIVDSLIYQNGSNIGIGSVVPAARLDIQSAGSTTGNAFVVRNSNNSAYFTVLDNGDAGVGAAPSSGTQLMINSNWQDSTAVNVVKHIGASGYANNMIIDTFNDAAVGAVGLGGGLLFRSESSTSATSNMGRIGFMWSDATNGSVDGDLVVETVANSGAMTERLRLTSVGNLGIGTSVPVAKLNILASGSTTGVAFQIDNSLYAPKVTVLDNGYVGIGSANPARPLDVTGGYAYDPILNITNTDNTGVSGLRFSDDTGAFQGLVGYGNPASPYPNLLGIVSNTTDDIVLVTGDTGSAPGTIRMAINAASGNIGVGTATPVALLHVGGGGTVPDAMNITGADAYIKGNLEVDGKIYGDGSQLSNLPAGISGLNAGYVPYASASTTIVDSVIYQNAGNIGIGTTVIGGSQTRAKLQVKEVVNNDQAVAIFQHGTAVGTGYRDGILIGQGGEFADMDMALWTDTTSKVSHIQSVEYANAWRALSLNANGGNVGVGSATPQARLDIVGTGTTIGNALIVRNSALVASFGVSDNGNVGIGTYIPSAYFQVKKLMANGDVAINLQNTSTDTGQSVSIKFVNTWLDSTVGAMIRAIRVNVPANVDNDLTFWTLGNGTLSEKMRIMAAGNIGIGTSTATARLTVAGSGTTTGRVFEIDDATYSPKVVILDNGNVGIGSALPVSKLAVVDTNLTTAGSTIASFQAGAAGALNVVNIGGNTTGFRGLNIGSNNYNAVGLIGNVASEGNETFGFKSQRQGGYQFHTSAVPAAFNILDNGYVAVGTTVAFAKLEVDGNIYIPAGVGNIGIGTSAPQANLSVGAAPAIPAGSSPVAAIKGNLVVDGKLYGDGSMLTNLGVSSGWTVSGQDVYSAGTGNVGVGSSTPRAKLEVVGAGTATGIAFQIDNSLYAPKVVVLDNGKVGIGTASPTTPLSIASDLTTFMGNATGQLTVQPVSDNTETQILLQTTRSSDTIWGIKAGTSLPNTSLSIHDYGPTGASNLTRFAINSSGDVALGGSVDDQTTAGNFVVKGTGNVGVGTSVPVAKFNILASGSTTGKAFEIDNSLYASKVVVLDNGCVGIGTAMPTVLLSVNGGELDGSLLNLGIKADIRSDAFTANDQTKYPLSISIPSSDTYTNRAIGLLFTADPGDDNSRRIGLVANSTGLYGEISALSFYLGNNAVSYSERMRISVAGNVGIGTSAPNSKLDVFGGAARIMANGAPTVTYATQPGDLYVQNNLEVDGNVYLGDAIADSLIVAGSLTLGNNLNLVGNIGINTTVPLANLEIVRTPATQSPFKVSSAAGSSGDYLTISSAGNVGIGSTIPTAFLDVKGSVSLKVVSKSSNYSADYTDRVILVDTSGGAVTITLPAPDGISGRVYDIKKTDSSLNALIITSASGNVDGQASVASAVQNASFTIVTDGSNWWVI